MRTFPSQFFSFLFSGLWAFSTATAVADEARAVSARMDGDAIVVMVDDREFTTYRFGQEQKYPFFHPVTGPVSGETLTTFDQEPFPHHSSLFVSLDNVQSEGVERGNYWQPRADLTTGHILSRNAEIVSQDGKRVVLRDRTDWVVPAAGQHQLSDTRTVTISAPSPGIRLMDFEIVLEAARDVVLQPSGHSFFAVRMRPELAVGCRKRGAEWADLGTGVLVDSLGNRNEEGTQKKSADWCAAYGTLNGATEGVAVIQHSQNSMYPAKWLTRDYGFMSPTPFTFDGPTPLKAGEKLAFRYRVVIFTGDHEQADIAGWRQDFEAAAKTIPRE
jgi:hypothetical protein